MAFCVNCGAQVDGRFCQQCGTPVTGGAASGTATPPSGTMPTGTPLQPVAGMSDNAAGALCYLFGFITGILFLVLAPYNTNRNIRFHAFQSIFLSVGWFVLWIAFGIISAVLHFVPVIGAMFSIFFGFCLWVGAVVLWIYMLFKTYNGEKVVLPVVGPMAEKQAGS